MGAAACDDVGSSVLVNLRTLIRITLYEWGQQLAVILAAVYL